MLLKYGFDDLVDRFNLPGEFIVKRFTKIQEELSVQERVRRILEELGTTFVKLGQLASMRPDLVPEPFIVEFIKLQDQVPPVDFSSIQKQMETELKRDIADVFSYIDEKPLASASVAQIHRAVLKDTGEGVVVKVQRPGIESTVRADLELMDVLARSIHYVAPELQDVDLQGLVAEFRETLIKELDFRREARNIRIFQRNFQDFPNVSAPQVYEKYSTRRVLTLEFIQAEKIDQFQGTEEQRAELAKLAMRAVIKQVLEDGFFHGDPHSGNVKIVNRDSLCFLDWGMVGRVVRSTRYDLLEVVDAVADQDERTLIETGLRLFGRGYGDSIPSLERRVLEAMDVFYLEPEGRRSVGQLMLDIVEAFRQHKILPPPDLALMSFSLLEAEGMARKLYPKINVIEIVQPVASAVMLSRYEPMRLGKRLFKQTRNMLTNLGGLPRSLSQLANKMQADRFTIGLEHKGLANFTRTLERTSNRLAFAIVTASLIIGSSMILVAEVKPLLYGYSLLGMIGYLFSALMGVWMVLGIIRKNKL